MGYTTYSAVGVPSALFTGVGLYMLLTGTPDLPTRAPLTWTQARASDSTSVLFSKKRIRIPGPLSVSVFAWDSAYSARAGAFFDMEAPPGFFPLFCTVE